MKEKNRETSKSRWSRIFKKKWFFPAVYLTVAALLLTIVLWYQSIDNQVPDVLDEPDVTDDYSSSRYDEEAETVLEQQEVIQMPVEDELNTEIVTKFYDHSADDEDQEQALILYNNRYHQSTGIDIVTEDGEPFDVLASLSGMVMEVKEDPLLGNVVTLSHENDVVTYYSSLGKVNVQAGQRVSQGDVLGTAGMNIFGKDNGNHVHFELRKNGESMNPEMFINQPVSKLDEYSEEVTRDDHTSETHEQNNENNEIEEDDSMQEEA